MPASTVKSCTLTLSTVETSTVITTITGRYVQPQYNNICGAERWPKVTNFNDSKVQKRVAKWFHRLKQLCLMMMDDLALKFEQKVHKIASEIEKLRRE